MVDWVTDDDGSLLPVIWVRAMNRDDLVYRVEGHLQYGLGEVNWEQGPYEASSLERFDVDVAIPAEAWMDDNQQDYVSTLVVRVVAVSDSGVEFVRVAAPCLKVVWPSGSSGEPYLMDQEEAEILAPAGIFSTDEQRRPGALARFDNIHLRHRGNHDSPRHRTAVDHRHPTGGVSRLGGRLQRELLREVQHRLQ